MRLFLIASALGTLVFFAISALIWGVAFRDGNHAWDMIRHTSIMFAPAFLFFGLLIGGVVLLFHSRKGFYITHPAQDSKAKQE
jgi:hypothetical protein